MIFFGWMDGWIKNDLRGISSVRLCTLEPIYTVVGKITASAQEPLGQ